MRGAGSSHVGSLRAEKMLNEDNSAAFDVLHVIAYCYNNYNINDRDTKESLTVVVVRQINKQSLINP